MNFTDIENQTDDLLLLNPVTAEIPKFTLHCHNKYLEFKNALSEYNTKELKELVKYNLDIKDYKVLNTLDSQDLKNALSAKLGNELLKRILGVSKSSDSMNDPFKALNAGTYTEMVELLDATVAGGKYRITFGGNTLVELTVCEKYSGEILQSVSGFIELRNYGIDVALEHNTLMRVKSAGVWSEWALVAGSDVVSMLSDETIRATDAEEELLKRIQGESDSSNPMKDPYKAKKAGNTDVMAKLLDDEIEGGAYRITFGNVLVDLNVYVRNSGDVLQRISGFIELRNYNGIATIDVSEKYNAFTRIKKKDKEWGEWQPVAGASVITNLNNAINDEIDRAESAEEEVLARLQGISENSNAANDPFKRLPNVSNVAELMTVLDAMHGSSANSAYNGRFRVLVGTQDVDIYNYVLGYQYDTWVQEIRSPYELYQTFTDKTINLPNGDYYLARKYNQELRMVSSVDYRGGTRTLRRMHNVDKWTNWVDTTNPYINSPLYGKNILLLGGSFAHNTRAAGTSNSGYGFTLFGREYSLQNYVAQELGLNRFDNYAISGNGNCTSKFTYSTFAQLDAAITYADEQEYTYDGIVIFGGVNDYMNNSPLGTLADPMGDDTFYASFKKIINRARTKYPTAKLYLATPFKGFSKTEFYNPASTVTNEAEHRYYEYVQALKEIALYASIPLLDIYSIHQVDTNNYGRYTRSSADDVLHPNGLGYQNIAAPLIEFLAWGKGAATFNNEALQMNLKQELSKNIDNKETELLARIQGTSEKSNAMKDPFKFIGSFNTSTIGDFRAWLDNLHSTSSGLDNRGFYRAILNDSVIEITSSPINYTTEEYIQVVRGRVSVASTTGLLTFSYEYNILERKYSATDGWSSWRVVASADKFEDLYAKAIQIGSFEVESLTDGLGVNFSNIDGTQSDSFEIPVATTKTAGVMSADMLNAIAVNAELIENKVISASGNALTNSYYDATDYIAIPNGTIDLSASGWIAGSALLVAFYDATKSFISGYGNFLDATSTFHSLVHFTIPENARYVRCSSNRVKDKTILVWGNREYNENINTLLPISIEWIDGEFVNRGGVISTNATWCRSDYSDVSDIAGITIKAYNRGTVLACAFYDTDYKYISGIGDYGYSVMTAIHINVAVPAEAKYMRVSTAVASKDDTVFLVNGMRIANNEDTITLDTFATQTIPAQFYRKQSGDSLRVLCFGSSWLTNTWWYLNKLTQAVGINATIKCYFSSACPFSKWVDRYEGKEETGTSTDFRRFDSVNGSDWSVEYVTDTTEFKHSLEEDWDVIVFQQGSSDSTNWDSDNGYANHYQKLMSYIKRSAKPWTVICYNNTWTPKLGAATTQTKEAQQKWQELNNGNCIKFTNAVGLNNFVIPCGAAVWALRNDSIITDVDDFMKDDLHIKNGLPIYLTGLTLFRAVVTPFYGIDIDDVAWLPDESTQKNPSSGSSWMSVDSEQGARVKQMVKLAFSNRYGFYTL